MLTVCSVTSLTVKLLRQVFNTFTEMGFQCWCTVVVSAVDLRRRMSMRPPRLGRACKVGGVCGCEIDRRRAGRGDAVQFCWRKRWGSNPQTIEGALFSRQAPSPSVGWLFRGGEGGSRSRIRSFERPCIAGRWLCQFAHLAERYLERDDELERQRLRRWRFHDLSRITGMSSHASGRFARFLRARAGGSPSTATAILRSCVVRGCRNPRNRHLHIARGLRGWSRPSGLPGPSGVLFQLSYAQGLRIGWRFWVHGSFWCRRRDSNPHPSIYENAALPIRATPACVSVALLSW